MNAQAQIRERPILFSGPMVRAILEGRKTQTRRVVKPQPDPQLDLEYQAVNGPATGQWSWTDRDANSAGRMWRCPYGRVGDRLWVRETHMLYYGGHCPWPDLPHRQAGNRPAWYFYQASFDRTPPRRWSPSIHMPRRASRLTLEVTDVRVERLHEIDEAGAIAEGVTWRNCEDFEPVKFDFGDHSFTGGPARIAFYELWDSLNAKRGFPWSANPWVWVVSFKKLEECH